MAIVKMDSSEHNVQYFRSGTFAEFFTSFVGHVNVNAECERKNGRKSYVEIK